MRGAQHFVNLSGGLLVGLGCHGLAAPVSAPVRTPVVAFSKNSRRRLRSVLVRLDWVAPELLGVTLTFPGDFPDGVTAKAALHALSVAYRRAFPSGQAVWKLEYQRRGAPHFHLLVRPIPGALAGAESFRAWLMPVWARLGGGFVTVVAQKAMISAVLYYAQYVEKSRGSKSYQEVVPSGTWSGRFWGVWGAPALLPERKLYLTPEERAQLVRVANSYLESKGLDWRFSMKRSGLRLDDELAAVLAAEIDSWA